MNKCSECGGKGRIVLFTSAKLCENCGGTGKIAVKGKIENGSISNNTWGIGAPTVNSAVYFNPTKEKR